MSECKGVREVGYFDCAGGGQVMVEGNYAYIGHITAPAGTSIVDVSDPRHPRKVSELAMERGLHSHKARASNGIMLTNVEIDPAVKIPALHNLSGKGGLGIHDVSDPARPKQISFWKCAGSGVHRFTFDGRYAYISPEMEGYRNNIVVILDLKNPARPEEVGRWWMPGQWIAGGETPDWKERGPREPRCHHPIRMGDRLYVSYWHGGGFILDIADMSKPKMLSRIDWSPPFPWPTHSMVPLPFEIYGHRWMLVADEDVLPKEFDVTMGMPAALWMVNITNERKPTPVGSFQVAGIDGTPQPTNTGCHQPVEHIRGNEVPCAWFAQGLRILDISNPHGLKEVASYMPDPAPGAKRVSSNDVFQDDRGLIYLIDRVRGLHIVERI
jgi:hypothetical protein